MQDQKKLTIHFLGAAETVTGSKFLIDTGDYKIMVDCGLFQGLKKLRALNWAEPPVKVSEIDVVLLTHGHMDHSGYLPRLVKHGFKGAIKGTAPTLDVARIILLDSAKIQEEEAEQANREGYSKHSPAEPLYTVKDAERAIGHFHNAAEGKWLDLHEGIQARFQANGHIIGSTYIELDIHGKRLVFSGDIGRVEDMLMRPPKKPERADLLFIETTYGDRLHPTEDVEGSLKRIVLHTIKKGGTLIIPSFAVERTQILMYVLWKMTKEGTIPNIPMIMDSPMGANVLNVFQDHMDWHKLDYADFSAMCHAFRIVQKYKETWEVIKNKESKIIIAGSGMLGGGRVLTYLKEYLKKPETTIMLAGFQAAGTRGRKLQEGARELKIYGQRYEVKAEVVNLQVLSAHADQAELLDWMSEIKEAPERIYLVHGEPHAADVFRVKVKDVYGWECVIPELYGIVDIEMEAAIG